MNRTLIGADTTSAQICAGYQRSGLEIFMREALADVTNTSLDEIESASCGSWSNETTTFVLRFLCRIHASDWMIHGHGEGVADGAAKFHSFVEDSFNSTFLEAFRGHVRAANSSQLIEDANVVLALVNASTLVVATFGPTSIPTSPTTRPTTSLTTLPT